MTSLKFYVDPEVTKLGLSAIALMMEDITVPLSYPPDLEKFLRQTESAIRQSSTPDGLKQEPLLRAFRDLHRQVGPAAKKEVSAPESLLRLLHRNGRLPRINPLVDLYNLVSAESRFALGAHDLEMLDGSPRLILTDGTERFTPLGSRLSVQVASGEYAYMDDSEIICRLEVRQCDKSKVHEKTTRCLFIFHGATPTAEPDLLKAADRLAALVIRYCGGNPPRLLERA